MCCGMYNSHTYDCLPCRCNFKNVKNKKNIFSYLVWKTLLRARTNILKINSQGINSKPDFIQCFIYSIPASMWSIISEEKHVNCVNLTHFKFLNTNFLERLTSPFSLKIQFLLSCSRMLLLQPLYIINIPLMVDVQDLHPLTKRLYIPVLIVSLYHYLKEKYTWVCLFYPFYLSAFTFTPSK